jgi:CheY-like chemotaxis protein
MVSLLTTLFELEGYDVEKVEKNSDILTGIRKKKPDCIFLDVHFRLGGGEEIDGFEVLEQIRQNEKTKDCKVIISSGMDYCQKSKDKGADGFLMKPFLPDGLFNLVKELIG